MTHDSFAASPAVLAAVHGETGFKVKVLKSGDAGKALSQALLVKDHPVADALFGVDNTFLSRALDNNLFEAYAAKGIEHVPARFRLDSKEPGHADRHRGGLRERRSRLVRPRWSSPGAQIP